MNAPFNPDPSLVERLNGREREMLTLLARGLTDREIARRIDLSGSRVRQLMIPLYDRLMLPSDGFNRRVLAALAYDRWCAARERATGAVTGG